MGCGTPAVLSDLLRRPDRSGGQSMLVVVFFLFCFFDAGYPPSGGRGHGI